MPRYLGFGLTIDSTFELAYPPSEVTGIPDVIIREGQIDNPPLKIQLDEEFVRIAALGEFHIFEGREIHVRLESQANAELVCVLLSGRIMAYLLRQRGWLPLHASAVKVGSQAVLFVAPVGAGKSTTAANFHSLGYSVVTDDVAPLRIENGTVVLCPGQSRLRLCEDAALAFRNLDPGASVLFDKFNFQLQSRRADGNIGVAKIYILTDGHEFRIQPIPAFRALSTLGRECFVRLSRAGPAVLTSHLRACAAIVSASDVQELVRPRDLKRLDDIVHLVQSDLNH